jgi:hypothetical protein
MNNLENESELEQKPKIESKLITKPDVKLCNSNDNKGIQVRLIEKSEPKITVTRIE